MSKFIFLALFALTSTVLGYPTGAPSSTCDSMTPGHGVPPQASELPQAIAVTPETIKGGEVVEINISGPPFKGFMLEVRNDDNKAVGAFQVADSDPVAHTIDCHGNPKSAVTQKDPSEKTLVVLKWKAPETAGTYTVFVTIVKDYSHFWAAVPTKTITVSQ